MRTDCTRRKACGQSQRPRQSDSLVLQLSHPQGVNCTEARSATRVVEQAEEGRTQVRQEREFEHGIPGWQGPTGPKSPIINRIPEISEPTPSHPPGGFPGPLPSPSAGPCPERFPMRSADPLAKRSPQPPGMSLPRGSARRLPEHSDQCWPAHFLESYSSHFRMHHPRPCPSPSPMRSPRGSRERCGQALGRPRHTGPRAIDCSRRTQ
jgi:hypothetical protein